MKKHTTLAAALAFSTALALPFFLNTTETQAHDESQNTSICEPFPDCVIYYADEAPEGSTEL
ncbi:hypothetical protein [Shewanella cyperi]|uniref:hypothetical protein n=1 Tax=Shewanella cyperi TaxID=2814292 RepID=UPI001A951EEF|nr:hypothetical protein [Shewanella cyperi]QSX41338.1 hypothetical protein JYB84_02570 [Shewanella cyperi]